MAKNICSFFVFFSFLLFPCYQTVPLFQELLSPSLFPESVPALYYLHYSFPTLFQPPLHFPQMLSLHFLKVPQILNFHFPERLLLWSIFLVELHLSAYPPYLQHSVLLFQVLPDSDFLPLQIHFFPHNLHTSPHRSPQRSDIGLLPQRSFLL